MRFTDPVSMSQGRSKAHRLELQLRELVAQLHVGDRLPGERELSARFEVARMTLRRALGWLIADGILERRHGSGTYVVPQPFVRLLGLTSFSQDMRERGLVPGSRLLSFSTQAATAAQATGLHVPVGTPIVEISRLRLASGEAMAVETVRMPEEFVPGLTRMGLDGSLYRLLASRYDIAVASAIVAIEPLLPDQKTSALLGIAAGQPCLRLKMVDSDARDRVIMTAECVYRGDKYHLMADVKRTASMNTGMRSAG
jgi:GntR family transcriptional regulator